MLLTVRQPLSRQLRFRFAAELGELLTGYLDWCRAGGTERVVRRRGVVDRYREAPQLIVPNRGGVGFLSLLGRSTRLRRTSGPHAVNPVVPVLGSWLSWLADMAELPGSSLLLDLCGELTGQWASGQSEAEDLHLGSLLAWIAPPAGLDGARAAELAEDPWRCPPAGPATNPDFDRRLAELITVYSRARQERVRDAAGLRIDRALRAQLEPTWQLVWQGIDLLGSVVPGARVARRWDRDRDAFTHRDRYLLAGGMPQPRRERAAGAARRLARLEDAKARFEFDRALDDPLVLAEHELSGDAFSGTVAAVEADRTVPGAGPRARPKLRPLVTLRLAHCQAARLDAHYVSPGRQGQQAVLLAVRANPDGMFDVDLELSGGLGRGRTPVPGSVPQCGEWLTYIRHEPYIPPADFPDESQVPWTHGGPAAPFRPTDADAGENWE
ncbi:hypothetical protein [Kitasatospora sp. NBC_01266]|uniref:hypothetical protein n=1 Tax=Kitasatospora sp. NBC_01266 TaxID=2903572 RepID=UPI002E2F80F3|nr:hypothetical protein [Kitasatospora sp. NBC_01266]